VPGTLFRELLYYKKEEIRRKERIKVNLSLERRCSSHTFRYGYLVTT
jgi:hypothetical protein